MGKYRYELKDSEWDRITEMLPKEHLAEGKRGRPTKYDNRTVMNGIVWIARSGAPWRGIPERYGKWQAVYTLFQKWNEEGIIESVFKALIKDADLEYISIDSMSCKVHESANGGKKLLKKLWVRREAAKTQRFTRWWMA